MSSSGSMRLPLPQRGRIRNKVYSEILGDISRITDLIAGESVLLSGSEDQIEAIEKDLIKWKDALMIDEKEGSSDEHLEFWVKIRDLVHKAQTILDDFIIKRKRQTERTCFIKYVFFFDDLIAGHRFQEDIRKIRSSVPGDLRLLQHNKVPISRLEIGQPSVSSPDDDTKESKTEVGLVRLDQFHDKGMVSMLTGVRGVVGKGRCVISIVGISGIGKTTFAKRIYEDRGIAQSFPIRAWVTVSNESEPEAVLLSIIKQVNVEGFHQETTEFKKMLSTGRYLIVLDDIWTNEAWDTLQAAFPDISNGSRIIITTPNKDVALHASSINTFELQPLSDEAGWEFFKTKVQVPDETIGKAIVRRCVGIPQMISETGASLSRKEATVEQWEQKLKELKRDQPSRYEALSEAANTLPSYWKLCLCYFLLFKEDYNIPARRLVVLWVAEGLVRQERNNEESPESIAENRLNKLAEQGMIQVVKRRPDGRVKTCRMHIILRDLWESKAKKVNFFHIDSNSTSTSSATTIRRLADHLDKKHVYFPHIHENDRANISDFKSHYKDLFIFLSFDTREGDMPGDDIGNFLHQGIFRRCFQGLRVLDLERVFRPKLPESIGKLIHMRYLGLRWTYLERLPTSINNLLNLQTLDLKNTYISVIPSSLWQMTQLRHLYLSENYRSRFVVPKGASPLTNLQTLWGAFVDDEDSVDGLKYLINLRKLGLVFHLETLSQQSLLARRILGMKGLESLRLVSIDKSVKPSTLYFESLSDLENLSSLYLLGKVESFSFDYLPEKLPENLPGKLTDLTLSLSQLNQDPMEELGKLQNLKNLKLLCNAYSKEVMRCPKGSFPELRVLKLWKQENLKTWILDEGSLKVLGELEIRRCDKLKEIPHGIKHLLLLRSVTLTDMPKNFTDRVKKYQGEDWEKIAHVPSLNIIPLPVPDVTYTGEGSSSQN